MTYRRIRACLLAGALALIAAAPATAAKPGGGGTTTEPIPNSMAAIGDSISRAFNAGGWYVDSPARSWSTGTSTAVNSHYSRILRKNNRINGNAFNDSVSGAKSSDLDAQSTTVNNRHVDYVTILMGANDACTSSESTMTDVATFGARYKAALDKLAAGTPGIRILAVSIPDIQRLWFIGKDSSSARNAWSSFGICQSMLANPQSTAQADVDRRARVRQRVVDFNTQIQNACAVTPHCKYDNNAVFGYQFVLSQVSSWDYFHPNESGQAVLANVTYAAGFGW